MRPFDLFMFSVAGCLVPVRLKSSVSGPTLHDPFRYF